MDSITKSEYIVASDGSLGNGLDKLVNDGTIAKAKGTTVSSKV